jgi:hypothetical protein
MHLNRLIFTNFLLMIASCAVAQVSSLINYQGALRDNEGKPIGNLQIAVQFRIIQAGAEVFIETQNNISVSQFGIFSTQIGKTKALDSLQWSGGPLTLEVSVDTRNGNSFTVLGTQQFAAVPYALRAKDVESSYTGGVLKVGANTYSLAQPQTYTAGAGISIAGGTVTNAAPDQTVSISPGNSNVVVTGAYPQFTVTSVPTLSLTNDQLSISNGNTVTIAPSLTLNGNAISVGPVTNSILLPAQITPSIFATGIASVSPASGNSFTVDVPVPSFTGAGASTVTGTYPNYTVNTPAASVTGSGAVTVSGSFPAFVVNTPSVTVSGTGASTVTGTFPTWVVNTPTPIIGGTGASTVTGVFPNYTVNTPSTSLVGTGAITIGGTFPSYSINTPSVTVVATGASTVSGTFPNYVVNTSTPNISGTGASTVSGSFPNYVVNTPTPNISGTGASTVSGAFPNYVVNTPTPNINGTGASTVSGTFPNYVVNTPTPNISGTGASTVSGTFPNYVVNTPTPNISGTGASTVSGAFPNYVVNTPTPNISGTGASTVSGTFPNYVVNTPSTSVTGTGASSVSGSFPNFVVNTPTPNIQGLGTTTVTGIFPNYTVNTAALTVSATGLAGTTVSGNTVTVNVPTLAYAPASGILSSGTNTTLAVPTVTMTNNVLQVGPSSNTVNMSPVSPWTQTGPDVTLSSPTASFVGIGVSSPNALLDMDAQSGTASGLIVRNGRDVIGSAMPVEFQIGTSGQTYGTNTHGRILRLLNNSTTTGFDFGFEPSGDLFLTTLNAHSPPYMVMTTGGSIGFGITTPASKLHVNGGITITDGSEGSGKLLASNATGNAGWRPVTDFAWGRNGNASTTAGIDFVGTTDNQSLIFKTNNTTRMEIGPSGFVGINVAPQSNYWLHIFRYNGDFGPNRAGISSYRLGGVSVAANGGSNFSQSGIDAAIKGSNDWGNNFSAGVVGHGVNDFPNSAAVIGADWSASYWGALAYKDAFSATFAGYFQGNVHVNGTLSKSAGSFKIDHPTDPLNKYLIHSFVESPDMLNIYNGNVTTDANGYAVVAMPSYFTVANIDYRYQLTVIGQFAQAIVSEEINNNQFTIRTDKPNVKVSWMVTGVRNDEYAKKNRIIPEQEKNAEEKGKYLQPELFGLPVNGSAPEMKKHR